MKYTKKPATIEAVQWTGHNHAEMCDFVDPDVLEIRPKDGLQLKTLEGVLHASVRDYIIKGVHGEFYPCKPDIFEETYRPFKPADEMFRELGYQSVGAFPEYSEVYRFIKEDKETITSICVLGDGETEKTEKDKYCGCSVMFAFKSDEIRAVAKLLEEMEVK